MDRRGNNAMRLIKTEEEKNLEKIYAPYYDYTKTPALSPDAVSYTPRSRGLGDVYKRQDKN